MAAKRGTTQAAKVNSLKSRRLDAARAGQVKGGLVPAVNLQHEGIKFTGTAPNGTIGTAIAQKEVLIRS
jgi:hypothetical protein